MRFPPHQWALILGGSSGFGLATARKLAEHGMHCCIVHRDRRGAMARIEPEFASIRDLGVSVVTMNADAPTYPTSAYLEDDDFARTIDSMGTSLVSWTRALLERRLFAADARVLGLTSEGNTVAWKGYAGVAAAKTALESVARAIAVELAPYGVRANVVQAGITDTPALRAIPGHAHLAAQARRRNPFGRLTTPRDVANVIFLLATDEAAWVNGALIRVDGGEHVAGAVA